MQLLHNINICLMYKMNVDDAAFSEKIYILNIMLQFLYFRWKAVIYLNTHMQGTLLINSQM